MGPKRERTSSVRVAVGSSEPRAEVAAKKYAATKKYGRRHELRPEGSKLAVYSAENPDEEDTVLHAQVPSYSLCCIAVSCARRLRLLVPVAHSHSPRERAVIAASALGRTERSLGLALGLESRSHADSRPRLAGRAGECERPRGDAALRLHARVQLRSAGGQLL